MISIKRYLEARLNNHTTAEEPLEAAVRLRRLLMEGFGTPGQGVAGAPGLDLASELILPRLEEETSHLGLLTIACDAIAAVQEYTQRTTAHFREQSRHMQSIVSMLTDTLADVSGESEASVARLQSIERQIEEASALDDILTLKTNLARCLADVKQAAVQQRQASSATVERLRDHIRRAPQPIVSATAGTATRGPVSDYVAVFKLQRADHILTRFGEGARNQMLDVILDGLKSIQGEGDRLTQWKGCSYLLFLSSYEGMIATKRRLSAAAMKISQRFVEVGKNAALLAVGVDWMVFQQAKYPSLDVVLAEIDLFVAGQPQPN